MSLREQILAAEDLAREQVVVPEWGGAEFWLRAMTGAEREAYETGLFRGDGQVDTGRVRARLVVFTAVDAQGQRIFADADVEELAQKSAPVLIRLSIIAQRLNGLRLEDEAAAAKK